MNQPTIPVLPEETPVSFRIYTLMWVSTSGDAHDNGCDVYTKEAEAIEAFKELCTLSSTDLQLNHLYYDGDDESLMHGVFAVQLSTHDVTF